MIPQMWKSEIKFLECQRGGKSEERANYNSIFEKFKSFFGDP
jgi:hypothetical protein